MASRTLVKKKYSDNDSEGSNKIKFINHSGIKYLRDVEIHGTFIVVEGPDAQEEVPRFKK